MTHRTAPLALCVGIACGAVFGARHVQAKMAGQCKRWQLDSPRRSGTIHGFFAASAQRLYAVGERGTIRGSTDGGHSWHALPSPTHMALRAITGSKNLVIAVGDGGQVLRSSNHGKTWRTGSVTPSQRLKQVAMCRGHAMAIGSTALYRANRTGTTWTARTLLGKRDRAAGFRLRHLVTSGPVVIAIAHNNRQTKALRSTDCGSSFRPVSVAPAGETVVSLTADARGDLYAFGGSRTVARSIMACGSCIDLTSSVLAAYVSTDRGRTWKRRVLRARPMLRGVGGIGGHHPPVVHGYGMRGWATSIGRAVFALDGGALFISQDRGKTWRTQPVGARGLYNRSLWSAGQQLWLIGRQGYYGNAAITAAHSADLGKTWKRRLLAPRYRSVTRGVVTGGWASARGNAFIANSQGTLASRPAGQRWIRRRHTSRTGFAAVWGRGRVRIAVGDNGTIVRSVDRGASYKTVASGTKHDLLAVAATGASNLYVAGKSVLLHSRDAGRTWKQRKLPRVSRYISMWGRGRTLFVLGVFPDVLLRSRDGGKSWADLSAKLGSGLIGIHGVSPRELYAFGRKGLLAHSRDGGKSWRHQRVHGGGHRSYWNQNISDLWADGKQLFINIGGYLARSRDRGHTWNIVPTPWSFRISRLSGTPAKQLLLVGYSGDVGRLSYRCKP